MPNKNTFSIKPIRELVDRYVKLARENDDSIIIDPFANESRIADITNDLNTEHDTDYNMDALEFLSMFEDSSVDLVLYDPPYSPRQVSESYKDMDMAVNMETTQSSYWGNQKKEIARVLKPNGIALSFGWNSGGIPKTYGFEIVEILLVAHGGAHNDTICTVTKKIDKER